MAERVPITIRGKTYASIAEAARAHNVNRQTVADALNRGRLDYVGVGMGKSRETKRTAAIKGLAAFLGEKPEDLLTFMRNNKWRPSAFEKLKRRVREKQAQMRGAA